MLSSISTLVGGQNQIHFPVGQTPIPLRSDFRRQLKAPTNNHRATRVPRIHTCGFDSFNNLEQVSGSGCPPLLRTLHCPQCRVQRKHDEQPRVQLALDSRHDFDLERVFSPVPTVETRGHGPEIQPLTSADFSLSRDLEDVDYISSLSPFTLELGYSSPHNPVDFNLDSLMRPCFTSSLPTSITKALSPRLPILHLHESSTNALDPKFPVLPSISEWLASSSSEDDDDEGEEVPVFYDPFSPLPRVLLPGERVWSGRSFVGGI